MTQFYETLLLRVLKLAGSGAGRHGSGFSSFLQAQKLNPGLTLYLIALIFDRRVKEVIWS